MVEQNIGIIDEHQPVDSKVSNGAGEAYNPTDEERKTIKLAMGIFEKNKKYRRQYDQKWLDNYKFFRGKQWKEQRPSYRHSEVINMTFQSIQSTVPILTDSRPRVEYVPVEPQDKELADILNKVFESDWESGNWLQRLTEMVYDAHFYSIGMGSVQYDAKADLGAGKIEFQSEDPFYCFPDPNARDVNVKSKNFVHAEPIGIDEAKCDYPDFAKYIKPDLVELVGGTKTELDQIRYRSPVDARVMVDGNETADQDGKDQCLKITCWVDSDEYTEERKQELGEDGTPSDVFEQKKKYPNGRKIVIVGGVLVEDGPNPYDDAKFPYARLLNYILPREYYGISEIEQLEGPQKIFNKLVSFALDVLTLMGNPIWIIDENSGVDTDNLFNRPGLVVEKNKDSEVRREEGVQLQPYVLQLIDRMRNWFDGISGASDVTRGVRPEGITAASAISELQDAAQTRIRLKSRNLDACLQNIGQFWVSRCFQFNSAPKIYRITQNENVNKYFKFYIEPVVHPETGEEVAKKAVVRPFVENPNEPGKMVWGDAKEYQTQGKFDVRVTTGSSLPFAKAQKINLATTLFDRGAIDEIELLKAADYPNAEAVWERVKQSKVEAAQQQAAMRAQALPPPQA